MEKLTRLARRLTAADGELKLSVHRMRFKLSEGPQVRSVAELGRGFFSG